MNMKHATEFSFGGSEMSYDEMEQLWNAVQSAGKECTVTIRQTSYSDGPYGTSTTTYIDVET